ncbi:hypothetical protein WJX75_009956 [Coccomyxa subellipsoidea]|uniref:Uncharacterized protein n=1 Tax=Coccomyxa subellipsoidea TaxID=248742 RepID=A0ABR2YZD4_9CHLO
MLMLVVLMSVEHESDSDPFQAKRDSLLAGVQRPRQSYEYAGLDKVCIRHDASIIFAQRLKGVIRQDNSTGFSAEQCKLGAGGGILLERLMPEIAYKLGRAYKYGA